VKEEKYPWIFLARQWRKLATFAWMDGREAEYGDRVLPVKYEDLVSDFSRETERICDFLGVDFDGNILDPKNYVDGEGKPWFQNTSHFKAEQKINPESVKQWEKVMSKREVEFVESVCFYEMEEFGYETAELKEPTIPVSLVFDPPRSRVEDLANWIVPYYPDDDTSPIKEMGLEYVRMNIIGGSGSVPDEVKKALCLDTELFDKIRKTHG
jgi:hypothetical protein